MRISLWVALIVGALAFVGLIPLAVSKGTSDLTWLAPMGSLAALLFVIYLVFRIFSYPEGTKEMQRIAAAVREGANAYLKRQYMVVAIYFAVMFVILALMSWWGNYLAPPVPFAFLTGGFFSGLCGYLGMKISTNSSARTAFAAQHSLNAGLRVAFSAPSAREPGSRAPAARQPPAAAVA